MLCSTNETRSDKSKTPHALVVFTVTLCVTNIWPATEAVLHSFHPEFRDGTNPNGGLIVDPAGNLYGTTAA